MTDSFEVTGYEKLGEIGDLLGKEVQRQVDLASKTGINKAMDLVTYGRTSGINARGVKADSAIAMAAKTLKIPAYHLFYRAFVRSIKVSTAKGRSAKPFASAFFRGTSINLIDLLVPEGQAKDYYGFSTRKKTIGKRNKLSNMRSVAEKARVDGRASGKVRVGHKIISNAYIEDGSTRSSSDAMNRHYMKNLGAQSFKLGQIKNPYFVFQRKHGTSQKNPYPSKVLKIERAKVMKALEKAASDNLNRKHVKISDLQHIEVQRKLKKLGFEVK